MWLPDYIRLCLHCATSHYFVKCAIINTSVCVYYNSDSCKSGGWMTRIPWLFCQMSCMFHNYIGVLSIIIWSRDTLLSILIIFRGCISQDNLSVVMDRNNLSVLILNLLRIRDVIIYNLMTLHSYRNACGNIWKIAGQFTQVKCSASKVCQLIFRNSFYQLT